MSKSHPNAGRRLLRAGIAAGAATAAIVAAGALPAFAASLSLTLSTTAGPSGGGNSLTGTVSPATGTAGPFPAGSTPTVQFQYNGTGTAAACTTHAGAVTAIAASSGTTTAGVLTVDPANVKRVSTTKIAFTVPSASYPTSLTVNTTGLALQTSQTSSKWNVCVYDTNDVATSTLLANSTYTISVRPTITGVSPASSPALGGQLITVNGTGFSTAANGTTVSVGGTALTNVKVATGGSSLTGTSPVHGPGTGLAVVVNTTGGSVSSLDPDNNGLPPDADPLTLADNPIPFTYSNGTAISPNTAAPGDTVSLDIQGVGFQSLTFSSAAAPTAASAHVFLVQGVYTPDLNHGVEECTGVFVISDNELVCTLNLGDHVGVTAAGGAPSATDAPVGTYTVTVVTNGDPTSTTVASPSIIDSGATFTVAPY